MTEMLAFLESVRHSRLEQERLRLRIAELEARCTKITASISGVPGGGGSDIQRQYAALADERTRLTAELDKELAATARVEDWIKSLRCDQVLRDVLLYRYINLMSIPQITEAFAAAGIPYSQRRIEHFLADARTMAWLEWKGEHK